MNYHVTASARQDIRQIILHIRTVQKSPQNARLVSARLRGQFKKLAELPSLGHVREETGDDVLVVAITGLLVIYDPSSDPPSILRVVHGSRDLGQIKTRP